MEQTPPKQPKKAAAHRSGAYPSIDLPTAIDRARKFYSFEKRSAANTAVAVSHWGYAPSSSGGKQTLAALLYFGLMKDQGSNDSRQVMLTELALKIILDERPDSLDRANAIREAALRPKIHQEILAIFPRLEVSDANLKHHLLLERSFNENGARDLIKELRSTVSYAKLDSVLQEDVSETSPKEDQEKFDAPDLRDRERGGLAHKSSWTDQISASLARAPNDDVGMQAAPVARTGMKQDTFMFPGSEGQAVFQWPATMSADDFEDLTAWLEIKLRGIKRTIR